MKISPENKKSKKNYPSIKDYKRKIVKATFTLGVILSPFTITSCMGAQRAPMHRDNQVQELKVNNSSNSSKQIIEEPIQKKGDISKPTMLEGDIADPVHVDDTKKEPCKDDEKKDELKDKPVVHPTKTRGVMIKVKDDK